MSDTDWYSPEQKHERAELARKLNLLMDVIVADDGKPTSYRALATFLEARGIKLSRARWTYMTSGNRYVVNDRRLLTGIAEFFEVDPSYLLGSNTDEIPAKVEAALQFVRAERLGAVRLFAARKLGEVSPETLAKLTAILDEAAEGTDQKPTAD